MSDKRIWDFWAHHYQGLWAQRLSLEPTRTEIIKELKNQIKDKEKEYKILDIGCGTGQLIRDIQAHFSSYSISITGIDYSDQMIKQAKRNQRIHDLKRFKDDYKKNKIKRQNINQKNHFKNQHADNVGKAHRNTNIINKDNMETAYRNTNTVETDKMKEGIKKNITDIKYIQMDADDIEGISDSFDVIICTHSLPYYENQRQVISKMLNLLKLHGLIYLALTSENNFYDSLIMKGVKLTTGKASYPSVRRMRYMTADMADMIKAKKIPVKFFMPSLYIFILKNKQ